MIIEIVIKKYSMQRIMPDVIIRVFKSEVMYFGSGTKRHHRYYLAEIKLYHNLPVHKPEAICKHILDLFC